MFTLVQVLPEIPVGSLQPNQIVITGTWVCAGLPPAASPVELRLTSPAAAPLTTVFSATASTGAAGQPPVGTVTFIIPSWPGMTCGEKIALEVRGDCGGVMSPWVSMGSAPVDCAGCARVAVAAPVYAACSGAPASQSVTLTATVMMNRGVTQGFQWDFGDGQSSAVQTVTSTGNNTPITLTVSHVYTDQPTPYRACLLTVGRECPPVCVDVKTTCTSTGCPDVSATVGYGACTSSGAVPLTYTLTFNPPLAQGTQAFVALNYGGANPSGSTSATIPVNTVNGPVASIQHVTDLMHRPGGYSSSATVTVIVNGQLCPTNLTFPVAPPACINCPDPANPVTLVITVPTDPAWCAPTGAPLAATIAAQVNWLAPVPATPPVPVRYDWVITAPGGAQTATRSSTTSSISTASGWIGSGALPGGAINLTAAGTYAVSVAVVYGANAGLPTDANGAVTCSLTGSAAFPLAACDGRTECPVLTGLPEPTGCIRSDGVATNWTFTAAVNDPAGSAQTYDWDFGDPGSQGNQIATATATASHSYRTPGTYTVTVRLRSAAPGCPNPASVFSRTITVANCPAGPPPTGDGGSVSSPCVVLLWASLIAMLVGGLMLVLGCLIATLVAGGQMAGIIVSIIGGIILVIGVVLFVIWALICSALTGCSVILAAISFVTALIWIFGIISAVIAIISIFTTVSWPCAFAAAANWGGWGIILAVLIDIARRLNCLIPGPGPGGAASSSSPLTSGRAAQAALNRAFGSSLGLGDRVSRMTATMGLEPCEGCAKRAAQLNALLPARST